MIELLRQHPDRPLNIENDLDAKTLLVEAGLFDKFSQTPGQDYGAKAACGVQALIDENHPTHFICGFYFAGKSDPKDNGYSAICLPKSQWSLEKATAFLAFALEGQGNVVADKFVTPRPTKN